MSVKASMQAISHPVGGVILKGVTNRWTELDWTGQCITIFTVGRSYACIVSWGKCVCLYSKLQA